MENGYVILGIIALLFLSMYGYAYFTVVSEKIKQKKQLNVLVEKEEVRKRKSLKNQEMINDRVNKFNERKQEIQHELLLLEKMKDKLKVS